MSRVATPSPRAAVIATTTSITARLDYTLSEKDSFFGRYTDFDSSLEDPGLPPFSGSFFPYAGKNFIFQETHVFSPRTSERYEAWIQSRQGVQLLVPG